MISLRLVLLAVSGLLVCAPPLAAADAPPLPEVWRGRVARVAAVAGMPVLRLEDGREVRLALVMVPPPDDAQAPWPPVRRLVAMVEDLVVDEAVRLLWPTTQTDRHGRIVAHVVRVRDGLWIQAALADAGMALVMPFADETAAAAPLLSLEAQARAAGRGLWDDPLFAVRRAGTVRASDDGLRLVSGRVAHVAEVRGTVYLNFGADWRRDFTGMIDSAAAKACRAAGLEPADLEGQRVRLRGWLRRYNGPLIDITTCAQVEVIDGGD